MRLRQVVLVARDLEPVVEDLCAVLGIEVSFRDPGVAVFGLRNAVMPVGDTFVEVVSPLAPDTAAGRFLERRGGDGGYMVMIQSHDLDADCRRLEERGVRIVWSIDLDDIRGRHLHPRDVGGTILSLDQPVPPQQWRWAGAGWEAKVRTDVVAEIAAVEIEAGDPAALAARWAAILGRHVETQGETLRIDLDRGAIRFAPAAGKGVDGVRGFDVVVRDREALQGAAAGRGVPLKRNHVEIGGTRIYLVD